MLRKTDFYINGAWVPPETANDFPVINPADETVFANISLGTAADVDRAGSAARQAVESWSRTEVAERLQELERLAEIYDRRFLDMAEAIMEEMGAPIRIATKAQAAAGLEHIKAFIRDLKTFQFERALYPDTPEDHILYEPIGVCGLITPWNWPMNQITLKAVPALAVGCSVVLKPSEIAPLSAMGSPR